MRKRKSERKEATCPVDLSTIRKHVQAPTLLAATLATRAGAVVTSRRPGRVTADIAPDTGAEINVRHVDTRNRAISTYHKHGIPVPPYLTKKRSK